VIEEQEEVIMDIMAIKSIILPFRSKIMILRLQDLVGMATVLVLVGDKFHLFYIVNEEINSIIIFLSIHAF